MTNNIIDKKTDALIALENDLIDKVVAQIEHYYKNGNYIPVVYDYSGSHYKSNKAFGEVVYQRIFLDVFKGKKEYQCSACKRAIIDLASVAFIDNLGQDYHPLQEVISKNTGIDPFPMNHWVFTERTPKFRPLNKLASKKQAAFGKHFHCNVSTEFGCKYLGTSSQIYKDGVNPNTNEYRVMLSTLKKCVRMALKFSSLVKSNGIWIAMQYELNPHVLSRVNGVMVCLVEQLDVADHVKDVWVEALLNKHNLFNYRILNDYDVYRAFLAKHVRECG